MAAEFEFIGPTDRPALLGLSTPEWVARSRAALVGLGCRVHIASNHEDFLTRFTRVPYQLVVLETLFAAISPAENLSLLGLQRMPMSQRRHAAVILLGDGFQSLNPLQAFQYSVHAVVNRTELHNLQDILQQVITENDNFMRVYREALTQDRARGR
jgi:hypothetical protein